MNVELLVLAEFFYNLEINNANTQQEYEYCTFGNIRSR